VCYAMYLDTFLMCRHDLYICTDIKVKFGCNGRFFCFLLLHCHTCIGLLGPIVDFDNVDSFIFVTDVFIRVT